MENENEIAVDVQQFITNQTQMNENIARFMEKYNQDKTERDEQQQDTLKLLKALTEASAAPPTKKRRTDPDSEAILDSERSPPPHGTPQLFDGSRTNPPGNVRDSAGLCGIWRDMAGYGGISKFPFFQVCLFFVVKMIGGVVKVFLGPSFPTVWIRCKRSLHNRTSGIDAASISSNEFIALCLLRLTDIYVSFTLEVTKTRMLSSVALKIH